MTDAVYIFGSYGTKYYDSENSDIDIAWFTNKEIDLITRIKGRGNFRRSFRDESRLSSSKQKQRRTSSI